MDDPKGKQTKQRASRKYDRPVSLHPLGFTEALEALLQTGPHPREEGTQRGQRMRQRPPKRGNEQRERGS